jgi:hypothetical protein
LLLGSPKKKVRRASYYAQIHTAEGQSIIALCTSYTCSLLVKNKTVLVEPKKDKKTRTYMAAATAAATVVAAVAAVSMC